MCASNRHSSSSNNRRRHRSSRLPQGSQVRSQPPEINHTWQADLIDQTAKNPSLNGGNRFALVVSDVFSRKVYTRPLKAKTPAAVLEAYKSILQEAGATPKYLSTDDGQEFRGVFDNFLEVQKTAHLPKTSINALAVVDAAIKSLRDYMKKDQTAARSDNWTKALERATTAHNTNSHSALMGSAPADVKGSKVLQFELEKRAGEDMRINSENRMKTIRRLNAAGAFRVLLPRSTWTRAGQPRYGDKVHQLDYISGSVAVAKDGTRVPIRDALPVPTASADTEVPKGLKGGRPVQEPAAMATMQPFADSLKRLLRTEDGPESLSIKQIAARLRKQEGFEDALKEAKISAPGQIQKFIRLFPELKLDGHKVSVDRPVVSIIRAAPLPGAIRKVPVTRAMTRRRNAG